MSKDIRTSSVSQAGLTFYKFDVVDQSNPNVVYESVSFTNKEAAQEHFNKLKQSSEAGSTVNGAPIASSDPFDPNDPSAFVDQGDTSAEQITGPSIARVVGYDENGNPILDGASQTTTPVQQLGKNNLSTEKQKEDAKNPIGQSKLRKLARDFCGFPEEKKQAIKSLTPKELEESVGGTHGGIKDQPRALRNNFSSEKVFQGIDNSCFVVIGNDRTSDFKYPGYGEAGHTQCDAIDLCAGLGGFCPKSDEEVTITDVNGDKVTISGKVDTNPNFFVDAARIYISQKTNCDRNFGIGKFGKSQNTKNTTSESEIFGKYGAKSAVIAKADNIRLIGRESIKIVTGTDEFNSTGGRVSGKHGIELIAMNKEEDLQPMVKGSNLALALSVICKNIEAVTEMFQAYVDYQMKFNKALSKHTHITQFHAKKTLPSSEAVIGGTQCDIDTMVNTHLSVVKQVTNIQGVISNFLSPSGDAYILSRLNKTN